jgi:DNA-binding transcriptional regulator GbsR (MarR family)
VIPEDLLDDRPPVKLAYITLVIYGPMQYTELQEVTGLSKAALSRALSELTTTTDHVTKRPLHSDRRGVMYVART